MLCARSGTRTRTYLVHPAVKRDLSTNYLSTKKAQLLQLCFVPEAGLENVSSIVHPAVKRHLSNNYLSIKKSTTSTVVLCARSGTRTRTYLVHMSLKHACLPISAPGLIFNRMQIYIFFLIIRNYQLKTSANRSSTFVIVLTSIFN